MTPPSLASMIASIDIAQQAVAAAAGMSDTDRASTDLLLRAVARLLAADKHIANRLQQAWLGLAGGEA